MQDSVAGQLLTVAQVASLMGVSENAVYGWVKDRRIDCETTDGQKMIAMPKLRNAKVLRQVDLLDRLRSAHVTEKDIAEAIVQGAARPSGAPDSRFSLEDCAGITALKDGTWKPTPSPALTTTIETTIEKAVLVERDEFLARAGRWDALVDYIANHKDPARLPPTFWDTRDCPPFMPPAGVFRFTLWLEGVYEQEEPSFERPERFTWIRRSEGRLVDNGRLYVALENAHYRRTSELSSPPGKEAPTFALENDQFRTLQMAWDDAWYVRRRQLRANGVNPLDLPSSAPMARRNRQETIEKYHFEGWGPADLPDWFWDMEECPPFEPPNGITRFEYTDPGPNPLTGERGTWISQSATWGWLMGQTLHFEPGNARVEWDLGSYPRGTVPMRWEHVNRVYEAAKHEWGEEWRRRSRRRRGD